MEKCRIVITHSATDSAGAATHSAKAALVSNVTVLLVKPFAGDRIGDNLNATGRLYYLASSTICCGHALSEEGGMVRGGQADKKQLQQTFNNAGFSHFRTATETPFKLILEARH